MDLKKFLPGSNEKEEQYYWALIIEPGWVQCGIWKIDDRKAKIVYTGNPAAWELDSELVSASDTVLSAAIQNFPEDFNDPSKTVFGVSYQWVKGGEITSEYLDKIKKICSELSLSPVGFVVIPEAIAHFIKSEEGSPLTAVVLGIYKENLELSLFHLGKLTGTTQIARSVSLFDDLVEGLTRISTGDNCPSRFLIYDGREGDLEDAQQELVKANWEDLENLKFLHSPKIEIVNSDKKVYAVSLAGASELADATSLEIVSQKEPPHEVLKEIPSQIPAKTEEEEQQFTPEELGFALEKDLAEEEGEVALENNEDVTIEEPFTPSATLDQMESNVKQVPQEELEQKTFKKSVPFMSKLKGIIPKFERSMPKVKVDTDSLLQSGKPLIWGIVFLFLLFAAGALLWWFIPRATVTIYVSSRKLEENVTLNVDPKRSDSDFGAKELKGENITTSETGEKTTDTTGTKTVGDKAKGEVTIYRVGPKINLSSGTLLNGPDNLRFGLDTSATIASGSASTPSETKIAVTAESIGAQYNLAAGTRFTVANYSTSDMEAKNSGSFAGGSSREIESVSKEDLEGLQKDLTAELREKAMEDFEAQIDENSYFIKESIETKNTDSDYDHKVGDEAKSVKLTSEIEFGGVSVKKEELLRYSEEVLKSKKPDGFVLRPEQINYSFDNVKKINDKYSFNLKISANLLPEISSDILIEKIQGKYIPIAQEYLNKEVPGFTRLEIKIRPSLPGKLKTIPHVKKNINLEIASDR